MRPEGWVVIIGAVLTLAGVVFQAVRTGRSAEKVAATTSTAEAYTAAAVIYKDVIDEVQDRVRELKVQNDRQQKQINDMLTRAQDQDAQLTEQRKQIEHLETELSRSARLLKAAASYISMLLAYIQLHTQRDDIPPVPPELDGTLVGLN